MQAHQIIAALRLRHQLPEWVTVTEFSHSRQISRIDVLAVHCWGQFERIAYEIKVSRSDFRRELANPNKRKYTQKYVDQFYFAAPDGLLKPAEIPGGCGLLVIYEDLRTRIRKRAPRIYPRPKPSRAFTASLARRLAEDLAAERNHK